MLSENDHSPCQSLKHMGLSFLYNRWDALPALRQQPPNYYKNKFDRQDTFLPVGILPQLHLPGQYALPQLQQNMALGGRCHIKCGQRSCLHY